MKGYNDRQAKRLAKMEIYKKMGEGRELSEAEKEMEGLLEFRVNPDEELGAPAEGEAGQADDPLDVVYAKRVSQQAEEDSSQSAITTSPARNRYASWSSPRAKTAAVVTGVVGANAMIASIVLTYAAPSFTLQQVLTAVGLKITLGAALATTPAFLALFVAGLALLAVTGLICMFACKCTGNNRAAAVAPMNA